MWLIWSSTLDTQPCYLHHENHIRKLWDNLSRSFHATMSHPDLCFDVIERPGLTKYFRTLLLYFKRIKPAISGVYHNPQICLNDKSAQFSKNCVFMSSNNKELKKGVQIFTYTYNMQMHKPPRTISCNVLLLRKPPSEFKLHEVAGPAKYLYGNWVCQLVPHELPQRIELMKTAFWERLSAYWRCLNRDQGRMFWQ